MEPSQKGPNPEWFAQKNKLRYILELGNQYHSTCQSQTPRAFFLIPVHVPQVIPQARKTQLYPLFLPLPAEHPPAGLPMIDSQMSCGHKSVPQLLLRRSTTPQRES